jgi:hypothetical protein
MGYDVLGSGLLKGGGVRGAKVRQHVIRGGKLRHFPDVHITDSGRIKELVPDFEPAFEFEYTRRELLLLAEKMLLNDSKPGGEHPAYLNAHALRARQKREIYCANGTPEPHIIQGMFWRTHPQGRPWATEEMRRATGCSFYSGVKQTSREILPPPPEPQELDCLFEGCIYPVVSCGLCAAHTRQKRAGKPLGPIRRNQGLSKLAKRLMAVEEHR